MSVRQEATQHGVTILGTPTKGLKSTAAAIQMQITGTTELRKTQQITKAKAMAFQPPAAHITRIMNTQGSTDSAQPSEPERAAST